MCSRGRPSHACAPAGYVHLVPLREPVGSVEPGRPRDPTLAESHLQHGSRVMRDASVPLTLVAVRDTRRPAPAIRRARSPRSPRRPLRAHRGPSGEPVPTIPGPTEQTTASNPCAAAQASADATPTACTSPSKHAPDATAVSTSPRAFSARTESDNETGSAPPGSCTYATPNATADSGHGRSHLRVQRAADDRHPLQGLRQPAVLLDEPHRGLERRVRKRHHVRVRLDLQPEPPRQVRVEHVEPARTELELTRLDVDDHLVPHLDRAGQARVRDARLAVDLDPREPLDLLDDGGDGAAPQAKRHSSRARRRRAPA